MNIVFFCKRHYMQKDVIVDRYARLYEFPTQLALLQHNVLGICLSYRPSKTGLFSQTDDQHQALDWYSFNCDKIVLLKLIRYIYNSYKLINEFKPDYLLGSSDCIHIVFTALYARLFRIPYYVDLYDNYESFGLAKLPGLLTLYRYSIKKAKGICCVSETLADYIRQRYRHENVITLESTITGEDFFPQDKLKCRDVLALPCRARIIGLAGALDSSRGIGMLYESFLTLAGTDPSLHLALAGPLDDHCPIPFHPRIHYFGILAHEQIPAFYNALDLAVVCLRDTEFGRYAFPQKTYEILACKTPILAARVGALAETFKNYPDCLYDPEDANDMRIKIVHMLNKPYQIDMPIPTWSDQVKRLAGWIEI